MRWIGVPHTGHGQLEAAVYRHVLAEGRDLLGKCLTSLRAQTLDPLAQCLPRALIQSTHTGILQPTRELEW